MSKIKKVLAMLLALTMVLGMSMTTFAADAGADETFGTADDKGRISVGGITAEDGIIVTAYQIVKANYANNGSFSGYEVLYPNVDPKIELPVAVEGVVQKADITEKQLTAIMGVINEGETLLGTTYRMLPNEDGSYVADVPVGSYLVVVSGAETKVYSPIVASVYYVNKDGQNALEEGTIVDISEEQSWIKVSDTPKVEKWILDDGKKKGNSIDIGDTIDYEVDVAPIPYYGGDYPVFNLVDTLDDGLTFEGTEENIKVAIGDTELVLNTDYTINISGQVITIDFVVDGYKAANPDNANDYTLNGYANGNNSIVVTYQVRVNDKATINQVPNTNDVVLNFTKDSKVFGEDDEDEDKVYSYTFDIDGSIEGSVTQRVVNKRGETVDETTDEVRGTGLAGAEFGLYTDAECKNPYVNEETGFDGTITTDKSGQMPIRGLETGTYYLKETKAPEGYSLNTHVFTIVIEATYKETGDKMEIGKIESWTITIDGEATSEFTVNQGEKDEVLVTSDITGTDIPNTKLTSLPSTGGIGTTIFTIGGCLIMIIAAGLFFASRRKSAK